VARPVAREMAFFFLGSCPAMVRRLHSRGAWRPQFRILSQRTRETVIMKGVGYTNAYVAKFVRAGRAWDCDAVAEHSTVGTDVR
jgi:hypothetical protein